MAESRDHQNQTPEIGERLKALRKAQGLSIRSLAEKARLSPNTISLIEANSTSPTVATLQTIANVLNIPLAAFFTNGEPEDEVTLIRAQDQGDQVIPGLNVCVLPAHLLDQRVRVMHFTIAPGMSSGSEPLVHPGDELVCCMQGELEYQVQGRTYRLLPGTSLAFNANLPHAWHNPGQFEAHLMVMITTEPDQTFRSHIPPGG